MLNKSTLPYVGFNEVAYLPDTLKKNSKLRDTTKT